MVKRSRLCRKVMEELNTLAGQVLAGPAHLNPSALRSEAKAQIFPFLSPRLRSEAGVQRKRGQLSV